MKTLSLLGIVGMLFMASSVPANAYDVIINEVDADQAGTDAAEFVELYDGGVGNTDLTGLVLVLMNGSDDASYLAFDLDGMSTNGQGYFVLCGDAANVPNCDLDVEPNTNLIQNGADAVALYTGDADDFPNDTPVTTTNLLDAIVYDTDDGDDAGLLVLLNADQPQVNERDGGSGTTHSNQRCPNGSGGARNTDTYAQHTPTPGAENVCPEATGACCSGESCTVVTAGDCSGIGGDYQGDDTTCDPNPCLPVGDGVIFNEILADPWHLPGGDANGDNGGAEGHFNDDEFVEIYNNSGADLDMSGWEIQDNGNTVHVFPPGTVVTDQCAIVVFGGGTPTGAFGGAVVQTSSTGSLSLSNSGATLTLLDAGAVVVASHTYDGDNPDTGQNTSITRDPDITGEFVQHITATGSGGALFSPGTKIDGSQFAGCPELSVVINEIHADPASDISGDANGDGVRHFSDDEFVEIVNNTGADLDMSGWEIRDNDNPVHVFPEGTTIPDQCAVVVFGGGTPTGAFGGAEVQTSSTGNLSLSNSGATITVVNNAAETVASVTYNDPEADPPVPPGNQNQSITRDPDITGAFVLHSEATDSGGALFSPGTKVDSTFFSGCEISEPACGDTDAGGCFEANGTPYCSDEECCLAVCAVDPFCCENEWNAFCADGALVECRSCGDPETGDCFEDNGTPYCGDESCCSTVCAMNPSCCEGPWNQACADMALANCPFNVPECNDLVFGLSTSDGAASLELVRGPAEENGGAQIDDFWDGSFIQSVEFDNLDGISHNAQGNLLGVNFGSSASGGSISSFATCSPPGAGALIGDTQGLGGAGLTQTQLGGLSVSPNNDKIAVTGFGSAAVIVYDYTAGDCSGNGAALSNARQTDPILCVNDTHGTAWLNNNTVLAFSTTGEIFAVDADSMDADLITTVDTVAGCGPGFTDIEYVPDISPNVYAMYSAFSGGTINLLFVLDPSNNLALLGTFNYSSSMNTTREIAFDVDGNLYATQFGSAIDVIIDAASLSSLADDVSTDWYTSGTFASFSGLDVAQCQPVERTLIVKQGACPAPVNPNSNGVIPMLLVGDGDFDVNMVDLTTLELRRCDGAGGVATPLADHTEVEDLNHPFGGGEVGCGACACNENQESDGIGDLKLKFRTDTTLAALGLTAADGVTTVELSGSMMDGSAFVARDCMVVVPPGSGQSNATMQSNVFDTFIDVAPLDLNVDSDGFADFSRSYVAGTIVTVTAPTNSQGRRFLRWSVDSVLQPIGVRTMDVTVGENTTLKAYYQRASRLRPHRPTEGSGDME